MNFQIPGRRWHPRPSSRAFPPPQPPNPWHPKLWRPHVSPIRIHPCRYYITYGPFPSRNHHSGVPIYMPGSPARTCPLPQRRARRAGAGAAPTLPMAGKESSGSPPLTRAAARRAAAVTAIAVAAKRKRVALTEISALSNAGLGLGLYIDDDVKPAAKKHVQRAAEPTKRAPAKPNPKPEVKKPPPVAAAVAEDGEENGDPLVCTPYASDIHSYLRTMEAEAKRRPATDYIAAVQFEVTANMRSILVDWLIEVAEEYKLASDTLYLTVYLIDRFLSSKALSRHQLQLLGVSAMLIASKYEEISPPNVEDFCDITDNTYTRQEVIKMERDILNVLKFEIGNPTTKTFLRIFIGSAQEENKYPRLLLQFLGSYLAELSMLDYELLRFLPSLIAASVVFVARLTLDPHTHPWSKKLQTVTSYKPSEMKDCVITIHELQLNRKGLSFKAIQGKYKQHRFKGVSALLPPVEIPPSYFKNLQE